MTCWQMRCQLLEQDTKESYGISLKNFSSLFFMVQMWHGLRQQGDLDAYQVFFQLNHSITMMISDTKSIFVQCT